MTRISIRPWVVATVAAGAALAAAATAPAVRADSFFSFTQGPSPTLMSIDQNSGLATPSGPLGAQLASLTAFSPSVLFGGTIEGDLFRIDAATGASTRIGNTGSADPLFGLTFLGGNLLGVRGPLGGGRDNLIRIDPASGAATQLGAIRTASASGSYQAGEFLAARGLTVLNGLLVTADGGRGAGGDLFALDPTSGLATNLSASGTQGIGINGLRDLYAQSGALYAVNDDPTDPNRSLETGLGLYQIDPATAATRLVGPVNLVPEPGTLPLWGGAALVGAAAALPRRRCRPASASANKTTRNPA